MLNEIMTQLTPTLVNVAVILLGYLATWVVTLVKNKSTVAQRALIMDIVQASVMFVEQIAKIDVALEGQIKFNLAKERALEVLNEKGLAISDDDLQMMIEAFVLELKGLE